MRLGHEIHGKKTVLAAGTTAAAYTLLKKTAETVDTITLAPAGAGDTVYAVAAGPSQITSPPGQVGPPAPIHAVVGGVVPVLLGEAVAAGDWLTADASGAAVVSVTPTAIRAREPGPGGSRVLAQLFG